jgi:hypothetical protein
MVVSACKKHVKMKPKVSSLLIFHFQSYTMLIPVSQRLTADVQSLRYVWNGIQDYNSLANDMIHITFL